MYTCRPYRYMHASTIDYCIKKDEQIYFYLKKYFELRFHLWTLPRENNMQIVANIFVFTVCFAKVGVEFQQFRKGKQKMFRTASGNFGVYTKSINQQCMVEWFTTCTHFQRSESEFEEHLSCQLNNYLVEKTKPFNSKIFRHSLFQCLPSTRSYLNEILEFEIHEITQKCNLTATT